jgi:LacI family transcriptional regulator
MQRLAGYQEAIRELGMTTRPEYVETGDFFQDSGYACAERLAALPERPTAVFVAGDEMAIGAMHAFSDAGVSIPGDMAVVGFDDIEAASLVRPALTTIAQDPIALGAAAVEALLTLVDVPAVVVDRVGAGAEPVRALAPFPPRTVPTRLVSRQSCVPKR